MSNEVIQDMNRILELQKNLNIKEGAPDINLRKDRLLKGDLHLSECEL